MSGKQTIVKCVECGLRLAGQLGFGSCCTCDGPVETRTVPRGYRVDVEFDENELHDDGGVAEEFGRSAAKHPQQGADLSEVLPEDMAEELGVDKE